MSRGELFGPYRLEGLIGRGGMGEVHRAYDTRRDRVVALKILPPVMATPQFEARFRRESQLVARLSAPHIIPIHDFGEIDGRLFLDMRLVRGVDLESVLEAGPLTPARAVEMVTQVAGALDSAHADGLVHRDVKPSNVLYVGDPRLRPPETDEPDFVYLVDFGIARTLDGGGSLTATGHAVGTLAYMAPERFSGGPTDHRIDVYALACTFYEALVGRPAFDEDGLAPMMYAHLHRMPPRASAIVPTLPPALEEVLATGLAKDPAQRYSSAGRLAEAARAALRGAPPRAPTRPLALDVSAGDPGGPGPAVPGSGTATDPAPTDQEVADRAPADQAHADRAPTDRAPTDRAPTDQAPTDQAPTDRAPTDRAPTDRAPTDRARGRPDGGPADRAAADRGPAQRPAPVVALDGQPRDPPVPPPPTPTAAPAGAPADRVAGIPAPRTPDRARPPRPPATAPTPRPGPSRRRFRRLAGAAVAATVLVAAGVVGVRALHEERPTPPGGPLAACGTNPLTCNGAGAADLLAGGEVTVAVDADVTSWNTDSPDAAIGPTRWAMGAVLPHAFTIAPDHSPVLDTDLLAGATLTTSTTVVYAVRPHARWDDGTPIGADDFALTWRMRNGRDCPACYGDHGGYELISAVTGTPRTDGGSDVTVTFTAPYPDWRTLFADTAPLYPAHLAARQGDPGTPAGLAAAYSWFARTVPTYSGGPLAVQDWQPGRALVLGRNPRWYGRPARLERVVLRVLPDPERQLQALRAGEVQVVALFPLAGLADQLTGAAGVQTFRGASAAWERIDVNLRTPALRAPALRRALFTALDAGRLRAIGTAVYGGAEPMAGQLLLPDQPGYRDRLAGTGQGSGDLAAARRLLTAAGYTGVGTALVGPDHTPVPPLRGVFAAGNPARARVADYVTGVARGLGLTVTADPVEPGEYGGALSGGAFDLVYYGWAMPPAQLATARSSWTTGGPDNLIGYSNPQVDRLLAAAVADQDAAADLLGQADELITRDAVTLPLYRRPTLLAIRDEVANVRPNASGGPLYDVVEWGLRRS